jgi:hypothetical protein
MLLTGRAMHLDDVACISNLWWTAVEPVSSDVRGFIMNYHHTWIFLNYEDIYFQTGARGSVVAKALRYKPAGRGFDSQWCHIFQ